MDRDNLISQRLMLARADIGDRLVPALDACLAAAPPAGDMQELWLRSLESHLQGARDAVRELQAYGVNKP